MSFRYTPIKNLAYNISELIKLDDSLHVVRILTDQESRALLFRPPTANEVNLHTSAHVPYCVYCQCSFEISRLLLVEGTRGTRSFARKANPFKH